jgi:hypothetical protein
MGKGNKRLRHKKSEKGRIKKTDKKACANQKINHGFSMPLFEIQVFVNICHPCYYFPGWVMLVLDTCKDLC